MGDQIRGRAAGPCMWGQAGLWGSCGHGARPGAAAASPSSAAVPFFQAAHGRLLCCSCSSTTTYYEQAYFTFQSIFLLTVI